MYELIRYVLAALLLFTWQLGVSKTIDCDSISGTDDIRDSDVLEYILAFQQNETDTFDRLLFSMYCYTLQNGDLVAKALIGLDISERNLVDRDKKFELLTESYLLSKQQGLEDAYFRSLDMLSTMYNSNLLLDKSLAMIQEYLSYAMSTNNSYHIAKARMLLGRVMRDLGKYEIAKFYLDRVISPTNNEEVHVEPKAWAYLHKGVTLRKEGLFQEAVEVFKKGELFCNRHNLTQPLSFIGAEMARTYTENKKNSSQAKSVLYKSLKVAKEKNLLESQAGIYNSLADAYYAEQKIDSCLHYLNIAYKICNENAFLGSFIYLADRLISLKEEYPYLDIDLVKIHSEKSGILKEIVELSYLESKNKIYDQLLEKALQESEVLEKKMNVIRKDNNLLLMSSILFLLLCGIIFIQYFNRIKLLKEVKLANIKLSKANTEMQLVVENLSSANDQLSNFAAIVAHDLKAPLGSMNRLTQLVVYKIKDAIPIKELTNLNIVVEMMKNLSKLVDQILTFSVINKDLPDSEPLELIDLIGIAEQNLNQIIDNKNIKIIKNANVTGYWHKTLIVQVLQNILSNAVKYSKNGSKVFVNCEKIDEDKIRIVIEDQGIGIEEKFLKSMFYIFSKYHRDSEYSGSGIGLATCKKIIDFYKGKIYAESEIGKGTRVIIEIPRFVEKLAAA